MNASPEQHPLETTLGHRFANPLLLEEALSHPSLLNENPESPSFERLEFLGDSVLGLVCSEILIERYPGADEGQLSALRSSLVQGKSLCQRARRLDLGKHIRLSDGEETQGGRERDTILEDALEALFGAVFLDAGLPVARALFKRLYSEEELRVTAMEREHDNPKGVLQERIQAGDSPARPEYEIVRIHGPAHGRRFEAVVRLEGKVLGSGSGNSKKEATGEAARDALRNVDHEGF